MAWRAPDPGELRHVVQVQAATETRDSQGGVIETFSVVGSRRSKVEELGSRELFQAQAVDAQMTTRVTFRYYPGLTTEHQLLYDGRTLRISSANSPDGRKEWHEVMCAERV